MINKKIGQRIQEIRKQWGISQIELAERVGVSFQQIQKYEKGITRISVTRLQQVSDALGMDITSFFQAEELSPRVSDLPLRYSLETEPEKPYKHRNREETKLLKYFRRIKNPKLRDGILRQVQGLSELEEKR